MNKEELIELSNQLRKKYFCAFFDKLDENKVIINEDYLTNDFPNLNILEIEKLIEIEQAVHCFEDLTENFVRFIYNHNIENNISKFKVSILTSYFLENNLKEKLNKETRHDITYNYLDKSNLKNNSILDDKVKITMSINEDVSMLDEDSIHIFENNFTFTTYFIVNYNEFVNKLTVLGYDVKYQNFDELLNSSITNCETAVELTTIDLKPQKILK